MTEENNAGRIFNHFASFRFERSFWDLEGQDRKRALRSWWDAIRTAAGAMHLYQVFPSEAGVDMLIWTARALEDDGVVDAFFERYAQALAPHRRLVCPVDSLWGFTGRSTYSKARSTQEIDPFDQDRRRYLVAYPFVKTQAWYLMGRDARQGMMNEHIRLGKQYTEITQLLLYSFGLQDQEFVVVYEMDDLLQFSDLVYELRSTEARRYTQRDTPLKTAVHRTPQALLDLWGAA